MAAQKLYDVLIIGGGPAGSTMATQLAKNGHCVAVLEKEKFPREHVGESLLPFCYHLFEELGVLDEMKRHFVRKPTVRFVSHNGSTFTNWCFNHVIQDESANSFHVVRSKFDQILLENARTHGVAVSEQTKVQEIDYDGESQQVTVEAIGEDGEVQTYHARFLVDASGRDGFMSKKNRWRKPHKGFERTALWTHWKGIKKLHSGLEEGSAVITYLGGEKRGWVWTFPMSQTQVTVGVVVDSFYLRDAKRRLQAQHGKDWQMELYLQELKNSDFIWSILEDAETAMPLHVEGDYSYYSEQKFGSYFALVGDAARFIDPIFSSGVFLSMKSSFLLSEALHEMFAANNLNDTTPLTRVYDQISGAYDLVYRLINLYYTPHAITFAEAGSAFDAEHKDHEEALAAFHYILAGDFFENQTKYHEFLNYLDDPELFRGYKNIVLDRKKFNYQDSCGVDPMLIFPELREQDNLSAIA